MVIGLYLVLPIVAVLLSSTRPWLLGFILSCLLLLFSYTSMVIGFYLVLPIVAVLFFSRRPWLLGFILSCLLLLFFLDVHGYWALSCPAYCCCLIFFCMPMVIGFYLVLPSVAVLFFSRRPWLLGFILSCLLLLCFFSRRPWLLGFILSCLLLLFYFFLVVLCWVLFLPHVHGYWALSCFAYCCWVLFLPHVHSYWALSCPAYCCWVLFLPHVHSHWALSCPAYCCWVLFLPHVYYYWALSCPAYPIVAGFYLSIRQLLLCCHLTIAIREESDN